LQEVYKSYFLGCSGYFYRDWRGKFYPEDLQPKDWLKYYSTFFNSLELNSTFYHFPKRENLRRLYRETPSGFVISVKVNRAITHIKKFRDTEEIIRNFYSVVSRALEDKLGCIMFQLPPSLHYSKEALDRIVSQLDTGFRNVLEFRHESWWREEVFAHLREKRVCFCSLSSPALPEELVETADFLYVRFHGKGAWYRYNYTDEELSLWAGRLRETTSKEVYVYFNNDFEAYAPKNCLRLMELLNTKPYREES